MIDAPKSVEAVPAGSEVYAPLAGDFFLVHSDRLIPRGIQLAQRLRFSKEESYWNHCGVFTGHEGTIIEALTKTGVTSGNISKYLHTEYIVVRVIATVRDRQQMLKFANWALGEKYSFLTALNVGLWCFGGGLFDFSIDGHVICSGLVARTLERAGYIFSREPTRESPADLAKHFMVHRILAQ